MEANMQVGREENTQQEALDKLARMRAYLAQDAQNPHLLVEVIDLCLQTGDASAARQQVDVARHLFPDDVFIAQREGSVLMAEGNWLAASAVFSRLLQAGPDAALAYNLAYAYFRLGQYAAAQALLQPYLEGEQARVSPQVPGVIFTPILAPIMTPMVILLMRVLHHLGDLEAALAVQQAHEAFCGGEPEFLAVSSLLLFDAGQLAAAQQASAAALAVENPALEALVTGGTLALAQGELALAQQQFDRALARNPADGRSLAGSGLAGLMQRDFAQACVQLEKAVAAMPQHIGTRHIFGWCKILMQDLPAAKAIFTAALALDRNLGESHGGLAVVAALAGERAEAEASMRRAQGLNPGGLAAQFAKILLGEGGDDPVRVNAAVQALFAQQTGPFGGSLVGMLGRVG